MATGHCRVRPVPARQLTIGVDLGGTKLLAGVVDADGTVLARERRIISALPLEALLDVTVEAVRTVGAGFAVDRVGFGIPALIDQRTGTAVRCVHLPLDGVDFGAALAPRIGLPLVVDNDVNCAMLAEWRIG